jgi:hypothetical protein
MGINFANSFFSKTADISRGRLVTFKYSFAKPNHDQNPLVLISDVFPNYIRGINVNYLTMPVIKQLIAGYCGNKSFSYLSIKSDRYIKTAFRQYKRIGVFDLKSLNCDLLKNVLKQVKTNVVSPNELEAIRKSVQEQIQKITNPKASDLVQGDDKSLSGE